MRYYSRPSFKKKYINSYMFYFNSFSFFMYYVLCNIVLWRVGNMFFLGGSVLSHLGPVVFAFIFVLSLKEVNQAKRLVRWFSLLCCLIAYR